MTGMRRVRSWEVAERPARPEPITMAHWVVIGFVGGGGDIEKYAIRRVRIERRVRIAVRLRIVRETCRLE
jgi:hypothetical protein